jgi:GNAT superfamily N-acetyltransferase
MNTIEPRISREENILLEANLLARFVYLSESAHMRFFVEPEISWFTTDIAYPNYLFNLVLRANFSSPEEAHAFINGLLYDAEVHHKALYWFVGPATQPAQVGEYLETYRFQLVFPVQGMKLELAKLNENMPFPPAFTVKRVENLSQLRQFVTVLARNSDTPPAIAAKWFKLEAGLGVGDNLPWQRYLGFWQGEPVAACSIVAGAGVVGLYQVATLPQARGHGLATAICLTALREARQRGHHTAVLHSTPMAVKIYRQLGFQPAAHLMLYRWQKTE